MQITEDNIISAMNSHENTMIGDMNSSQNKGIKIGVNGDTDENPDVMFTKDGLFKDTNNVNVKIFSFNNKTGEMAFTAATAATTDTDNKLNTYIDAYNKDRIEGQKRTVIDLKNIINIQINKHKDKVKVKVSNEEGYPIGKHDNNDVILTSDGWFKDTNNTNVIPDYIDTKKNEISFTRDQGVFGEIGNIGNFLRGLGGEGGGKKTRRKNKKQKRKSIKKRRKSRK